MFNSSKVHASPSFAGITHVDEIRRIRVFLHVNVGPVGASSLRVSDLNKKPGVVELVVTVVVLVAAAAAEAAAVGIIVE